MNLTVRLGNNSYHIEVRRGALNDADRLFNLNRRVLIVTDSGVPEVYAKTVAAKCKTSIIETLPQGEATKCVESFLRLLTILTENEFTRKDCVVAVGGGVVGDLAGFAAACYMRGIDFYNIPTTLLSQVDSSIGGKTAIDFNGYKNIVGAFFQPKGVLIDPDVLSTLDARQISNGAAEIIKMAATGDAELFSALEKAPISEILEEAIIGSLKFKKYVVEQDEHEQNLRKVLNFGHTIAHAIESTLKFDELYHGECVAIGMLPMCSEEVRQRLIQVLQKNNLPTALCGDKTKIANAMRHDKKATDNGVWCVKVDKIGEFRFEQLSFTQLEELIKEV